MFDLKKDEMEWFDCVGCGRPVMVVYVDSVDAYKGDWPQMKVVCPDCVAHVRDIPAHVK
jgi:hypothetical protein